MASLYAGAVGPAIRPSQFGAAGDGVVDDTDALQRAVSAAITQGQVLDLDRGIYKVTGSITGQGNIRIVNTGGAVIRAVEGTYQNVGVLVLEGNASNLGTISYPAKQGATTLTIEASAGLKAGEYGIFYVPADYSYSGFRSYYRAGEFFEVVRVNEKEVSIRQALFADYVHGQTEIHRLEPITGYINDIVIRSDGGSPSLLVIDYAHEFIISKPDITHANNDCIVFNRSIHCEVRSPVIRNTGYGGDDYGVVWSNCQHCRLDGGEIYARRHPVAIGGRDQVNGVPSRDVVVGNAVLRNDISTRVHCADTHGNSENCGYENCLIFGGFSPQGKSSFLRNSTVRAMSIGSVVYAAEIIGGRHIIEGNTFYFDNDPSLESRGAIDFGGNSNAITDHTSLPLSIIVRDNEFITDAFSGNTMLLAARNAGSVQEINVEFVGNAVNVNDYHSLVMVRRHRGIARSAFLRIEQNSSRPREQMSLYADGDYSVLNSLNAKP